MTTIPVDGIAIIERWPKWIKSLISLGIDQGSTGLENLEQQVLCFHASMTVVGISSCDHRILPGFRGNYHIIFTRPSLLCSSCKSQLQHYAIGFLLAQPAT